MSADSSRNSEDTLNQTLVHEDKTIRKYRCRFAYSDKQELQLEIEFYYNHYISTRRKAELATLLGLSQQEVKVWFQNRRVKQIKQIKEYEEEEMREGLQQREFM